MIAGWYDECMFSFVRNHKLTSKVAALLWIPTSNG